MASMRFWLLTITLSLGIGGCGTSTGTEEEIGEVAQGWSVAYCATATANSVVGSFGGGTSNGSAIDPAIYSPTTYNNCGKSYVVDLWDLNPAYTGPGLGGPPAQLKASWADTVATNQATCEDHGGGIIVYKRVGGSWVNLTGQIGTSGVWHPAGLFAAYCEEPHLEFTGLVAHETYRIAATMRIDSTVTTRRLRLENLKEVIIR